MTFKRGTEWLNSGGNSKGRPPVLPDFRVDITKDIIKLHSQDTKDILKILIDKIKIEKKDWALKLYLTTVLPYFLVKPKSEMEISTPESDEFLDKINNISIERRRAIQEMISKAIEESEIVYD